MKHWLGGILLLSAVCGPSEGSSFQGNEHLAAAIRCASREISASNDRYWMTVTVEAQPGVQVDWASALLETRGAAVVARDEGALEPAGDGSKKRMLTYRLRGELSELMAGNARIGPFHVRYRTHGGAWERLSSRSCSPGIRP